jgi:phytoene dehydrogenase-like protein
MADLGEAFNTFKFQKKTFQHIDYFFTQRTLTEEHEYIDKNSRWNNSLFEFVEPRLIIKSFQLSLFSSLRKAVRKEFKNPLLVSLLEFPVLFLGSTPDNTPAMYSMMNYADLVKGTWFPKKGMVQISEAFASVAKSQGVTILLNKAVTHIRVENSKTVGVEVGDERDDERVGEEAGHEARHGWGEIGEGQERGGGGGGRGGRRRRRGRWRHGACE